jgi:hypothetical protein
VEGLDSRLAGVLQADLEVHLDQLGGQVDVAVDGLHYDVRVDGVGAGHGRDGQTKHHQRPQHSEMSSQGSHQVRKKSTTN